MFEFLKRLFRKKTVALIDPEEIVEEFWLTDFTKLNNARFKEESADSHKTSFTDNGYVLQLNRRSVFAWAVNSQYRYRDFVLEALIEFPKEQADVKNEIAENGTANGSTAPKINAGKVSSGILFRYISESTFYSVQISDRGLIRFDAVMNGTPLPILGWTETTQSGSEESGSNDLASVPYSGNTSVFSLRIIARNTSFTLIVNDNWVAECSDETIQAAGNIAFSGQTWEHCRKTAITLRAISIDSTPLEVETLYTRWNQYLPIPTEAYRRLAETWYAMGRHVPAFLELRKAWKHQEPTFEDLLLAGRLHLAQRLYPEAENYFTKALALVSDSLQAHAEIASLYYLQNRWSDLNQYFLDLPSEQIDNSAFLSNLNGHLLSWKGEHTAAAQSYHQAGCTNPDQGIFFFNEGKEWHLAKDNTQAAISLKQAARLFLQNDEYDDLEHCLSLLRDTCPDDPDLPALTGKFLYGIGSIEEATEQLALAVTNGTNDSAVWYLQGMILETQGEGEKAREALEKAVSLEPDYGLYRYRLAEILFNAGETCTQEVQTALEKDPENGWVHNLVALNALRAGNFEEARTSITIARKLLPHELQILINFAEVERNLGNLDAILPLFSGEDPEALHAAANLLVEEGRPDEADSWYRTALHRRPFDPNLLTDCAANCLERDLINEADDLLSRAFDITTSERMYQLIAVLAGKKGEFARAEVALLQGLKEFPDNPVLLYELSGVYLVSRKLEKAAEIVAHLEKIGEMERATSVREELLETGTNRITCISCGRIWRVPKDIPAQGSLRLQAEPPDDLPAGTCPSCRETICIGCAKEQLGEDGRFSCKRCAIPLKLIDQNVIWLLNKWHQEVLQPSVSKESESKSTGHTPL